MLQNYSGTLIIVSHDTELLQNCSNILWHIDNGQINIFPGTYENYIRETNIKRQDIEQEISRLNHQKKNMHEKLMQEQNRAAKSKAKGKKSIDQRKWPTVVSKTKALRAEETSGSKKSAIDYKKQILTEHITLLQPPEIILPKFSIRSEEVSNHIIVEINDGSIAYLSEYPILSNISFSLSGRERVAIVGDNGTGKSTLIKAILGDPNILRKGQWFIPKQATIGYLDQHYHTLDPKLTVIEVISALAPQWSYAEIRRHLNDFLFRKNEEVEAYVTALSGGEKARLALAQLAAKTPKLLLLDEITNNLDLETKGPVVNVLKAYPGAIIVISHDIQFLKESGARLMNLSNFNTNSS
jgi:ATPase subunit of ABC transporter with duplicated ATPase domains